MGHMAVYGDGEDSVKSCMMEMRRYRKEEMYIHRFKKSTPEDLTNLKKQNTTPFFKIEHNGNATSESPVVS